MIYDKNLSTIIADKKLRFYIASIWINVFYTVLRNKMERTPHNIENWQFLWDPSRGFLGKSNGVDGPAQRVCRNAMDKLIAWYQLIVNNKGSIYSLLRIGLLGECIVSTLLSWLKCYNAIYSHLNKLVIMSWLIPNWVQYLHPQKKKRHQSIIFSHLQKSLVPIFWNIVGILFHILMYFKFCMMFLN